VFDRWALINNEREGRFLERIMPGAFTKTIAENKLMRCLFQHRRHPQVGLKPLGPIIELEEDISAPSSRRPPMV
jgi:phage head maturation protease